MNKILRSLALLPLVLLLCLAPARGASSNNASALSRIYIPLASKPLSSFAVTRYGPAYGRVLGVGLNPVNPATVYAMTYGSGMYKSVNAGASWFPISNGISYLTLQSMAVDPNNPNTLYAGTYGDTAYPYNGVFKSTDGGANWAKTGDMVNRWNGADYRNAVVYALEVDPNNSNRVFAGTRMKGLPNGALGGGGVFRTENGGATWQPVNYGLPNEDLYVYDLAIDGDTPGLVYAAMHQHGLYRSTNYGASWQKVEGPPWSGRVISIDPNNNNTLYFGAMKNQGAYRSTNKGASWTRVGDSWWDVAVGAISPDPYHPGRVYAGVVQDASTNHLFRSTNSGDSWGSVGGLNTWGPIAFAPDANAAYVAVDSNGVHKTINGGQSWVKISNGLTGYSVTGLGFMANNPKVMFASLYGLGVYFSKDGGATWASYSTGIGSKDVLSIAGDPRNPAVIYVSTTDAGVYRTTNGAGSWSAVTGGFPGAAALEQMLIEDPFENRPLPERDDLLENPDVPLPRPANVALGLAQANSLAVSPTDSSVLAATSGRGIYRLAGASWQATNQTTGTAYAFAFDRGTAGRVLAAVDAPSGGVLASSDQGKTWARSNTGIAGNIVYSIAQHPTVPSFFIAGTNMGVYYSTDGGKTWAFGGLPGHPVKAVSVSENGVYYAGSAKYAFYSTNLTQPWTSMTTSLNNAGVQGIVLSPDRITPVFITRLAGIVKAEPQ